jgi:arabinogalactan oligomer/maltooligosaccharide transport system permease protein
MAATKKKTDSKIRLDKAAKPQNVPDIEVDRPYVSDIPTFERNYPEEKLSKSKSMSNVPKEVLGKPKFWYRIKSSFTAWAYIAPAGLLMLVITLYPQVFQVWMAFTDYGTKNLRYSWLIAGSAKYAPNFVGFSNFQKIITSQLGIVNYDFGRLLLFNVVWTIVNLIFHVSLGVVIALILNQKHLLGRKVYRALFILPWAIPGYIAARTWRNMFNDQFGFFNLLAKAFNDMFHMNLNTKIQWLITADPPLGGLLSFLPLAFYAVLLANVWLGWPFMTVVATGALQSIPPELYEAAEMDGASGWSQFWNVTVPMIRPAMVPAIMLGTIWTFNGFNVIYFITGGDPFGRTEILVTQAFKLVYNQRLFGVAAAFGLVVFVILLIFTLINNRVTRATEAYNA